MKEQLPQGTVFYTFKGRCNALEGRPSEVTGDGAAPQLDSIVAPKVNYCKTTHWKYCPNVVGSSMAIFKETVTSSQYVTLKIVLQIPDHTMGQKKAICLLSDGGCLCLILFQVKTMNIILRFIRECPMVKLEWWMKMKREAVFPKTSQK